MRSRDDALGRAAVALSSALAVAAFGVWAARRERLSEDKFDLSLGCEEEALGGPDAEVELQGYRVPDLPKPVPSGDPITFATSQASPEQRFWPVQMTHSSRLLVSYETVAGKIVGRSGRRFLAERPSGRYHVAIDLFANEHDAVVTCEAGRIVAFRPFYNSSAGEMTYALLVEHSRCVVNYGEVKEASPKEFGWKVGDKIAGGAPIALVSSTNMLHLETYTQGTLKTARWYKGQPKPKNLLNPTT